MHVYGGLINEGHLMAFQLIFLWLHESSHLVVILMIVKKYMQAWLKMVVE